MVRLIVAIKEKALASFKVSILICILGFGKMEKLKEKHSSSMPMATSSMGSSKEINFKAPPSSMITSR